MGFEPTRAEHNGLAVHRLNLSATSSPLLFCLPVELGIYSLNTRSRWTKCELIASVSTQGNLPQIPDEGLRNTLVEALSDVGFFFEPVLLGGCQSGSSASI